MPGMSGTLVVNYGQCDEADAGVECLQAVERRDDPTGGDEQPAEAYGVEEGDAVGWDGAVCFVEGVLFWVQTLV